MRPSHNVHELEKYCMYNWLNSKTTKQVFIKYGNSNKSLLEISYEAQI
jgi:hypothetical protein